MRPCSSTKMRITKLTWKIKDSLRWMMMMDLHKTTNQASFYFVDFSKVQTDRLNSLYSLLSRTTLFAYCCDEYCCCCCQATRPQLRIINLCRHPARIFHHGSLRLQSPYSSAMSICSNLTSFQTGPAFLASYFPVVKKLKLSE